MPGTKSPKTHNQARQYSCAACGRGGAELAVSNALERLIKKYAHSMYSVLVESYPTGCCNSCKTYLYKCKKADDYGHWSRGEPFSEKRMGEVPFRGN